MSSPTNPEPPRPLNPEAWKEWLSHPVTKRVLAAMRARSEQIKAEWTQAYWTPVVGQAPDPVELSHLKGQAQACLEMSGISLEGLALLEGQRMAPKAPTRRNPQSWKV